MASPAPAASTSSANENTNYVRLCRLIAGVGCQVIREVFNKYHPQAKLQENLATVKSQLRYLRDKGVINPLQWSYLYPPVADSVNSANFDTTLLVVLLRNVCPTLAPPVNGWKQEPPDTDKSETADILRIKFFRNDVVHRPSDSVDDETFDILWKNISEPIVRLGKSRYKDIVDQLKTESMEPGLESHYKEALKQWKLNDDNIKEKMEQMDKKMEQMGKKIDRIVEAGDRNEGRASVPVIHITYNVINIQPSQAAGGSEQEQGAMAGVEALNPSTEERIWNFVLSLGILLESLVKYLRDNLNVDPKRHDKGSLVITVECSSLKILEGLWEDYCSGHLNAVAQETLITAEVLEKFGLSEIKLKTFISEKEYESGRQTFLEIKGEPEKEYESARQAFSKREMSDSDIPSQSTSVSGSSSSSSSNINTNRDPPKINFSKLPAKKELKMKDLLARSIPWDQVELPVDVLLLTVEDCEFLACVSYLNKGFYKSHHDKPGIVYFGKIGKKGQDTLKIALMKSYMGPMNALTTVNNAVEVLRPKAVIWVGSCRGLNAKKVNLGDVVVSSKLRTYANEKVTDKGNEDWNDAVPVSRHLSKLLLNAGLGWNPPLKNVAELEVKVQNGVILSGPKEVDSRKLHAELTGRFGEAIAIDMEGEGLYKASHNLKMEWAVIKGVADYADGTNSSTDEWKRFASFMAASLTANVLDPIAFENMPNYKGAASTGESKRKATEASVPGGKRPKTNIVQLKDLAN